VACGGVQKYHGNLSIGGEVVKGNTHGYVGKYLFFPHTINELTSISPDSDHCGAKYDRNIRVQLASKERKETVLRSVTR
jgi:hypothetical protein